MGRERKHKLSASHHGILPDRTPLNKDDKRKTHHNDPSINTITTLTRNLPKPSSFCSPIHLLPMDLLVVAESVLRAELAKAKVLILLWEMKHGKDIRMMTS